MDSDIQKRRGPLRWRVYRKLVQRENEAPIRVAVIGAGGSMGTGVCLQAGLTPGLRLVAAADIRIPAASRAVAHYREALRRRLGRSESEPGATQIVSDPLPLLSAGRSFCDVVVDCTDTVAFSYLLASTALEAGIDVVLMNAEVDYLLGTSLQRIAAASGAVVTSDAGDQHGVLARMITEARVWGFSVTLAGNIKGFLDRYATADSVRAEARIRNLSPHMCVAYTDGTKLNIEMALVANGENFVSTSRGMSGPRLTYVGEVMEAFDLDAARARGGIVDYVLGAEPGGGVFLIVHSDEPVQQGYLRYYKLGDGPYYLLYRPYHLCHLETPTAIASAVLEREEILCQNGSRNAEVIAVAKSDLARGVALPRGVGSDQTYGVIDGREAALRIGAVPVCLLDQAGDECFVTSKVIARDTVITWADVDVPDTPLTRAYFDQESLLTSS